MYPNSLGYLETIVHATYDIDVTADGIFHIIPVHRERRKYVTRVECRDGRDERRIYGGQYVDQHLSFVNCLASDQYVSIPDRCHGRKAIVGAR